MRLLSVRRILLPFAAALVALALAACHHENPANIAGGSTPDAIVTESAQLLKNNNVAGFWKHNLPPADYATMRADWSKLKLEHHPITAAQRAQFARSMQQLTAPGAETKLYAELQPKLTLLEKQYKDQVPVMIGIGQAIVGTGIAQSKSLSEAEKQQADAVLAAVLPWAKQAPWFDQAKAKQAIDVLVATARQLDLKDPDELRSLDFDAAMSKYAQAFGGIKQLLAIYGLSIDDMLDTVKASTVSMEHGYATVQVTYTLLGTPLSANVRMELIDGRWYDAALVADVRQAHQQLLQQQAAAVKAASSAPAATASVAPAKPASAPAPATTAAGKPTGH